MNRPTETNLLWDLIPDHVKVRDEHANGFLRGLVEVLAQPTELAAEDIDALGDDFFIETCAEWLVPYIGDLLGEHVLHSFEGADISNRARIADTLRYRRRKGTAAMLEELARASTGWRAKAVEYFEILATTQHLNHIRVHAPATAAVRDASLMELVDTPFDRTCHTVDVRPMCAAGARPAPAPRHNLVNVGLFVWPMPSYPLDRATAVAVSSPPDGRWFVESTGVDRPMAGPTVAEASIEHRAGEANVPTALRRRPLHDELDAVRGEPPGSASTLAWFRSDDPSFVVWIQPTALDPMVAVPLTDLFVGDLSDWSRPTGSHVRVDPALGRVTIAKERPVHRLAVSWAYAFSGDLGAGPYRRHLEQLAELAGDDPDDPLPTSFQIGVSVTDELVPATVVPTLADALDAWHAYQTDNENSIGRIVLMDSHRYVESFTGPDAIVVAQGCRLTIVAAAWPTRQDEPRRTHDIDLEGVRPVVVGDIEVRGEGDGSRPGELWIDGVLIDGAVRVVAPAAGDSGLGVLGFAHSTVVPGRGGIDVEAGNDRIAVVVHRSIVGKVRLAGDRVDLRISDSIVDGAPPAPGATVPAIDATGADAVLAGVTVLGKASLRSLRADDSIFDDVLTVVRRQQGCLRFCSVTPGSQVPRRYRCQPDGAVAAAPADAGVLARLEPAYVSRDVADAGYARLAEHAAIELRTGAESGADMGSFGFLLRPQRLANLLDALVDYVPFGREAAALPAPAHEGVRP